MSNLVTHARTQARFQQRKDTGEVEICSAGADLGRVLRWEELQAVAIPVRVEQAH
jgi:uncharacterized protein YwlG (UPF0340 family)